KGRGIPILGVGGIRTASDAIEFIIAGAWAVGVGTANFIEPGCAVKIIEGIRQYCIRKNVASIRELVGSLE
ncbi:MAG: dihydroorotate dehydrogenase, partial [Planctomycetota bacterium]